MAQTNFSTVFINRGGNYSIVQVSRKTQYIISPDGDTFITSHSLVSKYVVKFVPGVIIAIANFHPDKDVIDLTSFSQISSFDELPYRTNPFTLLLPSGQTIILTNIQLKGDIQVKNFLFSTSVPPSTSNDDGTVHPTSWDTWKIVLIAVICFLGVLFMIAYSYYRCTYMTRTKTTVLSKPRISDAPAQDALNRIQIAPAKESLSGLRDDDDHERKPSVSATVEKNQAASPIASELSSSFLSSTSSISMGGDEDEREVQSKKLPKKKKREDFCSSRSINIRDLEEGLNEKLIELRLSKESYQLLNEAVGDVGSESDDSFSFNSVL